MNLTPTEQSVHSLLLRGYGPHRIAEIRKVSVHTIHKQVRSICSKAGVNGAWRGEDVLQLLAMRIAELEGEIKTLEFQKCTDDHSLSGRHPMQSLNCPKTQGSYPLGRWDPVINRVRCPGCGLLVERVYERV